MNLPILTLLLLSFILVISSCNETKKKYLNTSALEEQVFTVDPSRDTTLLTKAGMIIDIPANAITVPNGGNVSIQVKEALGLKEMMLSGLTTKSDSGLLSSQGMFYIGTSTPGAEIKKQLSAKLPVEEIIPGTETFTGVYDEDSALQWVVKKNTTKPEFDEKDIAQGKSLFESNCKACHNVIEDATGPPLAGMTSKYSMDWIVRFTRNYNDLVRECDCDAITSANARPSAMNLFPTLKERDIRKIFAFVDGGEIKKPTGNCADSCKSFITRMRLLENQRIEIEAQAQTQVSINYEDTTPNATPTSAKRTKIPAREEFVPAVTPRYLVLPNYPQSYYYQINIDAWGWYNADILLKNHYQLSPSSLIVSVPGYSKENLNVSLVVPSVKCLTQGGLIKNSDTDYAFMDDDGKIRLPMGNKAYVLVYGDVKGKFFFAAKEFTVAAANKFTLQPKDADPGELQKYMLGISDELKAQTKETDAGKKLEKIQQEQERVMKEQPNCNCACYNEPLYTSESWLDDTTYTDHGYFGDSYNPCPDYPRKSRAQ